MNNFTHYNPVKIVFGQNSIEKLDELVGNRKALLITTKGFTRRGIVDRIKKLTSNIETVIDCISPNPTMKDLSDLYGRINHNHVEVIVAFGGGSVIDAAKVLSVYRSGSGFSVVEKLIKTGQGEGYSLCPIIGIPTTSGTSSEITPWATVWDMDEKRKYSLHLKNLWCETALYDPCLTLSLPKDLTIQTGLDALSHSLESIWNKNANYISRDHAVFAAKEILDVLPKLVDDLSNIELRERMMYASLKSGLAFSNTQTSIAHAISYYLTLNNSIPHGIACSITLPSILKVINGQDVEIDKSISEIFNHSKFSNLNDFMNRLGSYSLSTIFNLYGVSKRDLDIIKASLSKIQRAQNSKVNSNDLFQEILNMGF